MNVPFGFWLLLLLECTILPDWYGGSYAWSFLPGIGGCPSCSYDLVRLEFDERTMAFLESFLSFFSLKLALFYGGVSSVLLNKFLPSLLTDVMTPTHYVYVWGVVKPSWFCMSRASCDLKSSFLWADLSTLDLDFFDFWSLIAINCLRFVICRCISFIYMDC